jgi:hypothetical protein
VVVVCALTVASRTNSVFALEILLDSEYNNDPNVAHPRIQMMSNLLPMSFVLLQSASSHVPHAWY